jgi:hypothetical protein
MFRLETLWNGPSIASSANADQAASFGGRQGPPASLGQIAQGERADADAQQVDDLEADQVAHAADLAVAALLQHETKALRLHLGDAGRFQLPAVQFEAMA